MTSFDIRRIAIVLALFIALAFGVGAFLYENESLCSLYPQGTPGYDPEIPMCVMDSDL
ncbi:MAG: hypothetical protein GY720_17140 [bacterium]|nr:hypothetical protein [bacterium]